MSANTNNNGPQPPLAITNTEPGQKPGFCFSIGAEMERWQGVVRFRRLAMAPVCERGTNQFKPIQNGSK